MPLKYSSEKDVEKILLKLLRKNDEVRSEIREILSASSCDNSLPAVLISDGEVERLRNENSELEFRFNQLQGEYDKLNRQFSEKSDELEKTKEKLKRAEEERDEAKEEREKLDREYTSMKVKYKPLAVQYNSLDDIYRKYLNLGSDVHRKFQRVLNPTEKPCDSAAMFLGFGVQEGNLIALWDTIAANVEEFRELDVLEVVVEIFNYFFDLFRKISYKSIGITSPYKGDSFDERYHTRTADSNVYGEIVQVILPGFTIGRNINRKALVLIK